MSITALRIITPADSNPVTLAQAKSHLRVTHEYEDETIQVKIDAATSWAESQTLRILVSTVVELRCEGFPSGSLPLAGGRVTAIEHIKYIDTLGAEQTLTGPTSGTPGTDYQESLDNDEWAFVYPTVNGYWPSVQPDTINAVTVQYTVGYGIKPETVPAAVRQAILFKLADMYSVRDSNDSKSALLNTAEALLFPHVIHVN